MPGIILLYLDKIEYALMLTIDWDGFEAFFSAAIQDKKVTIGNVAFQVEKYRLQRFQIQVGSLGGLRISSTWMSRPYDTLYLLFLKGYPFRVNNMFLLL